MAPTERATAAPALRFGSIAIVVSDLARALEWYTRRLGLDVIERGPGGDDEHWVVVGRAGQNGGIHLCDIPTFDPNFPVEPGVSGIDLKLPGEFESGCAALRARGVEFTVPARQRPWGWEAQVVDPDGNVLRITPDVDGAR